MEPKLPSWIWRINNFLLWVDFFFFNLWKTSISESSLVQRALPHLYNLVQHKLNGKNLPIEPIWGTADEAGNISPHYLLPKKQWYRISSFLHGNTDWHQPPEQINRKQTAHYLQHEEKPREIWAKLQESSREREREHGLINLDFFSDTWSDIAAIKQTHSQGNAIKKHTEELSGGTRKVVFKYKTASDPVLECQQQNLAIIYSTPNSLLTHFTVHIVVNDGHHLLISSACYTVTAW